MAGKSAFFTEIVGFRIYLALWVAIGHGLQTAGYFDGRNPVLGFLLNGHEAVILFMIVSGFVITNLLQTKRENYSAYITRRFFRLFPAYALACVAGYLVIDAWASLNSHMPWSGERAAISATERISILRDQVTYNLAPHLAAHAVMLHGLLPDEVLLRSPMTLLPAAWSVSLEWQFYLLAPAILAMTRSTGRMVVLIGLSLAMFVAFKIGLLGHYAINATIAGNMPYFLLGIASRQFYDRLAVLPISPVLAAVVVVLIGVVAANKTISLTIWGIFYGYSLWHKNSPFTGPVFRFLTQSKPFQLLGESSYSLYLIHRPIQITVIYLLMDRIVLTHQIVLATQILAICIALPVSILIFFTVERPGIAIGRKIAARLRAGNAESLRSPEPPGRSDEIIAPPIAPAAAG